MLDLPYPVLLDVVVGVSSFDLVASSSHGELQKNDFEVIKILDD